MHRSRSLQWLRAAALRACLVLSLLALGWQTSAYASEYGGAPAVRHYLPTEYGGSDQIFGISQLPSGEMLFADVNDRTLLRFDGARWRTISIPGDPLVLQAGADPRTGEERVWLGAAGDLGFLELLDDPGRSLRFVSLHDLIPSGPCLVNDRFDDIVVAPDGIFFGQNSALLRWDGAAFTCWTPPPGSAFGWNHHVAGRLFVGTREGQFELVDDELVPLPDWGHAAAEIDALDDGRLMVLRHGERPLEIFDPSDDSFTALAGPAATLLQRAFVQKAVTLPSGDLAVALGRDGLMVLDESGQIVHRLDLERGLPGGEAYRLFVDREGILWVSVGRGIAAIDFSSAVEMFPVESSVSGFVTDVLRHRGRLYLTTFDGVFWFDEEPASSGGAAGGSGAFRLVGGDVQQGDDSWQLAEIGGALHAVTDRGVLRIENASGARLPSARVVSGRGPLWIQDLERPDRVLAVGNQRLQVLDRSSEPWESVFRLDLPNYAAMAVWEADDRYWIAGDGLLTIADFSVGDEPPRMAHFRESVEWYGIDRIGGRLTAWGDAGVFVLEPGQPSEQESSWIADPRFADFDLDRYREHPWGYDLQDDLEGGVWVSSAFGFERWSPQAGSTALTRRPEMGLWGQRIGSVLADPDRPGVVWFERDGVVSRYDAALAEPGDHLAVEPLIARTRPVVAIPADGGSIETAATGSAEDELPYSRRTVRFEYAAPRFMESERVEYRVMLEGYDEEWLDWNRETRKDYTGLLEGDYVFRVQARVDGALLGESSYSLAVHPPWYRSTAFRLLLALLALAVVVAGILMVRRRLRVRSEREQRERAALELLVAERTAQLREANQALEQQAVTDALTGLHNRRFLKETLRHDLASIRRNLAAGEIEETLAFLLIDLNRFKEINDSFGHAAGDRVLQAIAARLSEVRREADYLLRWGGDEFLVVSRSVRRGEIPDVAERISRAIVDESIVVVDPPQERRVEVSASIGFCVLPLSRAYDPRQEPERTLELADRCLYLAKAAHDGGWCGVLASHRDAPVDHAEASALHLDSTILEVVCSDSVNWAHAPRPAASSDSEG